ncbi:MAG: type II secretion system protein [Candidatus Saccharimonas sp.]
MNVFTSYPHPTRKTKQTTGFTIVELLIVIVVIAILAAISIVSYNGIQQRAKVAIAQSNLKNLMNAAELFKIDSSTGEYPRDAASFKAVLKRANLWDSSRVASSAYMICSTGADVAFVPNPAMYGVEWVTGAKMHYIRAGEGLGVLIYNTAATGSMGIQKVCTLLGLTDYFAWSHGLPVD